MRSAERRMSEGGGGGDSRRRGPSRGRAIAARRSASRPCAEGSEGEAIERHMPLVRQIVQQVEGGLPPSVEHDEVLSWAVDGLLDAIRKFDGSLGTSFSGYARIRIRGAILDQLRSLDWASRTVRQKANRLARRVRELEHQLGRAARQEEIAEALEISLSEYHAMQAELGDLSLVSLEDVSCGRNGEQLSYEEFIAAPRADPLALLLAREERDEIARAMDELPGKERLVLPLYYSTGLTMKEVGQKLGITESRVSQLHGKALGRLRSMLADQPSPVLSC